MLKSTEDKQEGGGASETQAHSTHSWPGRKHGYRHEKHSSETERAGTNEEKCGSSSCAIGFSCNPIASAAFVWIHKPDNTADGCELRTVQDRSQVDAERQVTYTCVTVSVGSSKTWVEWTVINERAGLKTRRNTHTRNTIHTKYQIW